jgi:hypothetical protein
MDERIIALIERRELKEKLFMELEQRLLDDRMKMRFKLWFHERVKPLLPKGWTVSFWPGFYFSRWKSPGEEKTNPQYVAEFQLVCQMVEKVMKVKLFKAPNFFGKELISLSGSAWYSLSPHCTLHVDVTLYETKECQIVVKQKLVDEGELLNDCLGGGG